MKNKRNDHTGNVKFYRKLYYLWFKCRKKLNTHRNSKLQYTKTIFRRLYITLYILQALSGKTNCFICKNCKIGRGISLLKVCSCVMFFHNKFFMNCSRKFSISYFNIYLRRNLFFKRVPLIS